MIKSVWCVGINTARGMAGPQITSGAAQGLLDSRLVQRVTNQARGLARMEVAIGIQHDQPEL